MYRLDVGWGVGGGIGLDFPLSSAHSCLINISAGLRQDEETTTIT